MMNLGHENWSKRSHTRKLPALTFKDGEIEIDTHILKAGCGQCHYLCFNDTTWRDKFYCEVYRRNFNHVVSPEFGEDCSYKKFERLFLIKPINNSVASWLERSNAGYGDAEAFFMKKYENVLQKLKARQQS